MKISYNAPVVLSFDFIATIVAILAQLLGTDVILYLFNGICARMENQVIVTEGPRDLPRP